MQRQCKQRRFASNAQMHITKICGRWIRDFEGRTADEMADDTAYQEWVKVIVRGNVPTEKASFFRTSTGSFGFVINDAFERQKELAIVAHGGSIMAIMSKFAILACNYYDWYVPNRCSGNIY